MLPDYDNSGARPGGFRPTLFLELCALWYRIGTPVLASRPINLNLQVADLLAQRIAIDAEQVGGADLIAAGGGQGSREQRAFDLAQNAVVQAGRRQTIVKAGEIARQIAFDGAREIVFGAAGIGRSDQRRLREFGVDHRGGDGLLRIKRSEAARQVSQLAHIARPTMTLEPIERGLIDLFERQALARDQREEMADQVGNVLGALAQRRQTQRHDIEPEEQILT